MSLSLCRLSLMELHGFPFSHPSGSAAFFQLEVAGHAEHCYVLHGLSRVAQKSEPQSSLWAHRAEPPSALPEGRGMHCSSGVPQPDLHLGGQGHQGFLSCGMHLWTPSLGRLASSASAPTGGKKTHRCIPPLKCPCQARALSLLCSFLAGSP